MRTPMSLTAGRPGNREDIPAAEWTVTIVVFPYGHPAGPDIPKVERPAVDQDQSPSSVGKQFILRLHRKTQTKPGFA